MTSSRILVTALAVTLGWVSPFSAVRADDFIIAERGQPASCSIELPSAPTEVERYAAEELRDWTEKLTGVRLPIGGSADRCVRIVRGTPDLGDDGFRLTVRNGALEISGNRRGSLYGVYEILERFGGIGWFSRIRTVVPDAERLSVPGDLDDRQVPAFVKREILWMDALEPVFAARLRAHGHYQPALPKTGGRTYYTGGGQEPCNSFFRVLNRTPGNTFKDHPEYYSEVNGRRIPDGQLCLSNPDVIRIYTANLLDIIRSDPTAPQFIVSIEDRLGYCTCPQCRAIDEKEGGPSGSVITFVNRVAAEVVKEFPHVRILTNAYLYMLKPPKHVKPHPAVLVTFCPIEVDRRHPIATGRNPANVEALTALKEWAAITKDLFVWDYTTDYIGFLTPFANVPTFQANLQLYRACGITGGMMQGDNSGIHGEFAELKAWLLAKLMWNPDQPTEPLLDRFFRGYYGAAAPIVRTYFDELNALARDEMKHPLKVMQEEPTSQVVPNSFLRRGRRLWRQAEEAVKDDPECSYLVRMGALSVDYTTLARSNFDYDVRRSPLSESAARQRRELAASVLARFREAERREGARIALAEGRNPEAELKRLERIASGDEKIVAGKDGAVVISPKDLVTWGRRFGSFVEDAHVPGGKSFEINLENCAWSAEFPLAKVRFDSDVRYRLRALVGVTKAAGAGDVPSMEGGIVDRFARKEVGKVTLKASQLKEGYSWYDICTFVPGNGQVVWIGVPERGGSPAALKSMRLAGLEISVESDVGIRPVGVDGQEAFWNAHAERFMYPPQFGFAAVDGAERYRFKVITDAHVALDFEAERPDAFLTPVWDRIPENGFVTVLCFALDGSGRETALAGERRFFKVAAFKEGSYPKATRPYAEAARMVYDYIFALPSTRHFLETGRPDRRYELNTYPTKMHSALVGAMVRYAKLRPDRAAEALKLAHLAADYLISISQPAGAPLAFMPPTYEGDGLPGYNDKGENMLVYPANAGRAYLALHGATGEAKYLEAARRIAETYLKLQGEDGTCFLKIREKDGVPVAPNRAFPLGICEFLVQLGDVTGEGRYRAAADRGFELIDRGPLRTWNWEGQFEDVKPSERYHNLTLHSPCATALYVLSRYPGDARRIAQARQLLAFSEDQFVVWERPCRPDGTGARSLDKDGRPTNADDAHYLKWSVPGVLEQYRCYVPIDSAAAKVMRTCLAVHKATGEAAYLAKARALADSLVAMQQPSGRIQTFWRETPENEPLKNDWINCMIGSADALATFAEYGKAPFCRADDLVLAERGKPAEYAIVVPEDPNPVVQYAAEELRDWTEKLTGVRLPIETNTTPAKAVYVGGATEEGLGTDGFRVKAEGKSVRIVASPTRGVLYGVYELLETYGGIGWFASWHTVVPEADRFAVPGTLDDRQVPAFEMREPFDYDINRHPDFAARLRRNSTTWGVKLEAKHGGSAFRYGAGLEGHSYDKLVPVAKYFDAHPEWFSEVNGRRIRERTQLCLTNPELLETLKSNFIARVKSDPGKTAYSFVLNDCYNCCTCAKCKAVNEAEGSDGGTNLRAANRLAEELERISPRSLLKTAGYYYTQHPPKLTHPRHNVLIDIDPIGVDYSRPIPDSPFRENGIYAADLVEWGRHAPVYVFDYVTNFENYYSPFPNIFSLRGNVRFFRDNGVRYLFEEGAHTTPHAAFAELKTWLLAKWLWNPELPVEPLLTRFLEGFYGKGAAPIVRKYIDALHALPRDPVKNPMTLMESFQSPVYPDAFLWESLKGWIAAEKAARADGPAYVRHVRWGMMSPVSMILQREAAAICVRRTEYPDARVRKLAKWMVERMDEIGPDFLIQEGGGKRTAMLRKRWTALADPANVVPPSDRAVAEAEDAFRIWGGFRTGLKDDPLASGGKAICIPNAFSGDWILYMEISNLAFDEGETYRYRVRARVDRKPGSPFGEMFSSGIGAGVMSREFATDAASEKYRWYDVGEWTPMRGQQFYLAPGKFVGVKTGGDNPAFERLWIDQVEFSRVERGK